MSDQPGLAAAGLGVPSRSGPLRQDSDLDGTLLEACEACFGAPCHSSPANQNSEHDGNQ